MDDNKRESLADWAGIRPLDAEDLGGHQRSYIQSLSREPIQHSSYKAVLKRVAGLHLRSLEGHLGGGILVTGQSGSGKSFFQESYSKAFLVPEDPTRQLVPVLLAEVPPRPTVASVVAELLGKLGVPPAPKGTTEDKETKRLLHFTKKLGTEIVFLDEINNFHDHAGPKVLSEFTDWLKAFHDKSRLPLVLFGLPRSRSIILKNMQLRRRFVGHVSLSPLKKAPKGSWFEFRSVLRELHSRTPIPAVKYWDQLLARRFYFASAGLMDYLIKIVEGAIEIGHAKRSTVSEDTLARAFSTKVWIGCPDDMNPFTTEKRNLRLLTRHGEPFDDWDNT